MGIKFKWDPSLGGIKGPTCEYRPGTGGHKGTRRYSQVGPSVSGPLG